MRSKLGANWDNDELVRKSNIISLKDNTATLESFDEPISFEKANDKSSLFAAWNITYGKYSFKNGRGLTGRRHTSIRPLQFYQQ